MKKITTVTLLSLACGVMWGAEQYWEDEDIDSRRSISYEEFKRQQQFQEFLEGKFTPKWWRADGSFGGTPLEGEPYSEEEDFGVTLGGREVKRIRGVVREDRLTKKEFRYAESLPYPETMKTIAAPQLAQGKILSPEQWEDQFLESLKKVGYFTPLRIDMADKVFCSKAGFSRLMEKLGKFHVIELDISGHYPELQELQAIYTHMFEKKRNKIHYLVAAASLNLGTLEKLLLWILRKRNPFAFGMNETELELSEKLVRDIVGIKNAVLRPDDAPKDTAPSLKVEPTNTDSETVNKSVDFIKLILGKIVILPKRLAKKDKKPDHITEYIWQASRNYWNH